MNFYTIGVYNSSAEDFFWKLIENNIDTFVDIRQRRGVRGAQYAFVNSNKLQTKLQELNINYEHVIDLAPTKEIRQLQKDADAMAGDQKRSRKQLGKIFTIAYKNRVLQKYNFDQFIDKLDEIGANNVVLFCVEEEPEACHRSIVGSKLNQLGFQISHL
ncbi:DUF488 domain-containing protein [Zeaxanthinibacter sp. PT1]|uniref:DUF488 domain-containing protein n=1 Tax=Zeaxanthinibacter TaxID=561554 RepID=UPI00234A5E9E|nr:DUF488 domain-containing protein [Zeaxanthinibacter sp. PT1]MDC6350481.1 DUF488 domain-containing protein [Zeaxanthinibacter sp. PT1]